MYQSGDEHQGALQLTNRHMLNHQDMNGGLETVPAERRSSVAINNDGVANSSGKVSEKTCAASRKVTILYPPK